MKKRWMYIICLAVLLLFPSQMFATTVVIDPGHGGHDPGAMGINGLKEKDINLDISKKLAQQLHSLGYDTIMTRETDIYLTLQERVTFANQSDGDLFVSIHVNAHSSSSAYGTLVLYYDDAYPNASYPASSTMRLLSAENKALAQSIQSNVIEQVHTFDRGIVPSVVFVVRNGTMPSVLIETAFISNKDDAQKLSSDSFRTAVAAGIAAGISKYQPPIFYDVHNHWAKENILMLEALGVIKGDNGAFHPNQPMTRAEFITILDRLFSFEKLIQNSEYKEDEGNEMNEDNIDSEDNVAPKEFADLTDKHWAYPILLMGVELGIIHGFEDGTIRPNAPISRAEMVVLFDKLALSSSSVSITNPFMDVPEQSWYSSSVYKMSELGYVHGVTDTSFAPNRQMSRAEGATIISRYLRGDNGLLFMDDLQPKSVQ